jgi:hypothetical protein
VPRLMSVAHTLDAVVARRKTETRRLGWLHLPSGCDLDLCEKVMGRRKGEPLVRVARVHVNEVHREPLGAITDEQVYAEGFTEVDLMFWPAPLPAPGPTWSPAQWFVAFYADRFLRIDVRYSDGLRRALDTLVTRIVWTYLPDPPPCCTGPSPCSDCYDTGHAHPGLCWPT